MKRNPQIELSRLIACLIVVGVHTCLSSMVGDQMDRSRLYIACLFADGVALFWLIMGMFFFREMKYSKLWKRTVKSICIPLIAYSAVYYLFSGWLIEGTGFKESIHTAISNLPELGKNLLGWQSSINYAGHLWYLYIYLFMILIFPAMKAFFDYLKQDVRREKIFLIIAFLFLVWNDVSNNKMGAFSHHSINALIPASVEVLMGGILYRHKDRFSSKKWLILGPVAFFCLNGLRTVIQYERWIKGIEGNNILFWYTSIGVLCAVTVILFSLNLIKPKTNKINKVICWLASFTFPIYLIHPLIKNILNRFHVQDKLQEYFSVSSQSIQGEILFTLSILGIVFGISLGIAIIIRFFRHPFAKAMQ